MKQINQPNCDLFSYLHDGVLKNTLLDRYLDEPDSICDILDFDFDASLIIERCGEEIATIILRLECDDFLYQTSLDTDTITNEQRLEIEQLVLRHSAEQRLKLPSPPKQNILRKKRGNDLLNIAQTSQALGLSQRKTKELIPCNDLRIVADGAIQTIEEYYWDRQLIQHFTMLKQQHHNTQHYHNEDLLVIAEGCCDGDIKWAQDIVDAYLSCCDEEHRSFVENRSLLSRDEEVNPL